MQGRIFGIKKSTILKISGWINLGLTIFFVVFSLIYIKNEFLWFFFFCFFVGAHCLLKSLLFKLDSSCYLGFLLVLIGIAGFFCYFFDLNFKYLYFLSALGVASILTFLFTHQKYQLFVGALITVETALAFLFCFNILNLTIFLATSLSFFFIFLIICVIILARFKNKCKRS